MTHTDVTKRFNERFRDGSHGVGIRYFKDGFTMPARSSQILQFIHEELDRQKEETIDAILNVCVSSLMLSQANQELMYGDGTGKQEPDYKAVVNKIGKMLKDMRESLKEEKE